MKGNVLITGGTGLIGKTLTPLLEKQGYDVAYLSRNKSLNSQVRSFFWDHKSKKIDKEALKWADHIINLAGANVAAKRWNKEFKKEIYDSRINSTRFLFELLEPGAFKIKSFISASAIGIYRSDLPESLDEYGRRGEDFLAAVTKDWECEMQNMEAIHIRTVMLRIGVVLSPHGGALEQMAKPVRYGVGAKLGSGKQYMSWIHVEDVSQMFLYALENENLEDAYNAVAPHPVTNAEMTKTIAKTLRKPLWIPPVPAFVLKIIVGELGDLATKGMHVDSSKIREEGFEFAYPKLEEALDDLLKK